MSNGNCNNHYNMKAVMKKGGWSNEKDMLKCLNLQDALFSIKNEKMVRFEYFEKKRKLKYVHVNNVFYSKVYTSETEKTINVQTIEENILKSFDNNFSNESYLKDYIFLQIMRTPHQYLPELNQLDELLNIEEKFHINMSSMNKYERKFDEDNFLKKIQVSINQAIINSFTLDYKNSFLESKRVAVIDVSNVSDVHKFLSLGDVTAISFNSFAEDFFTEYKMDISVLKNSYLVPISISQFLFLYENQEQLNYIEEIKSDIVDFYNKIQFFHSSKIALAHNQNLNLFLPSYNIVLKDSKEKMKEELDSNLNIKLNKFLEKNKNEYLSDYLKYLKDIKKIEIFREISQKEKIECLNNLNVNKIFNFIDLEPDSNMQCFFENILLFKSNDCKILFFFSKNGTVFYSINDKPINLFCFHFFDFLARFLIEAISKKLPINYQIIFRIEKKIMNSSDSYYKKIITDLLINKRKLIFPTVHLYKYKII